jgi:hypothetical protein
VSSIFSKHEQNREKAIGKSYKSFKSFKSVHLSDQNTIFSGLQSVYLWEKSYGSFSKNIAPLLRKSIFRHSWQNMVKYEENTLVFEDYDHQKFIFKQNAYDIRNQYKNLHRITYILFGNIFYQNSA